jgi:hypothetical protein
MLNFHGQIVICMERHYPYITYFLVFAIVIFFKPLAIEEAYISHRDTSFHKRFILSKIKQNVQYTF